MKPHAVFTETGSRSVCDFVLQSELKKKQKKNIV
jgi:hypothetical protein